MDNNLRDIYRCGIVDLTLMHVAFLQRLADRLGELEEKDGRLRLVFSSELMHTLEQMKLIDQRLLTALDIFERLEYVCDREQLFHIEEIEE